MKTSPLIVRVDNRIRIPLSGLTPDAILDLKKATTHKNPEYGKKLAMRFSTWNTPPTLKSWREVGGDLTLPRGAMQHVREILNDREISFRTRDEREEGSIVTRELVYSGHAPRPYQKNAVERALAREQGIVRAATGTGKTTTALLLASKVGLNTLIVLPNAKLLDQTVEAAEKLLGLRSSQIGVVRGGKRKLRPLTVATQQTLWSRGVDEELKGFFGCVIVDEAHHCFEGSTPVLMADGTLRQIRELREGDVVALGGRVLAKSVRWHEGEVRRVNGVVVTSEHPFATSDGWVPAKSLDTSPILFYDPLHGFRTVVSIVRETATPELQSADASSVRSTRVLSERGVPSLREDRFAKVARLSHEFEVQRAEALERRTHDRDVADSEGGRRCAERQAEAVVDGGDARAVGRPGEAGETLGVALSRTTTEVLASGGARGEPSPRDGADSCGEDVRLRTGKRGQWTPADAIRERDVEPPGGRGIRGEPRCDDGQGSSEGESEQLQDRSCAPVEEDRDRDRRQQSSRKRGGGCQEDLLPSVAGLDGAALPGSVRLRRSIATLHPPLSAALTTYNLETEGGVYVAGGMLVHNSAARTFGSTIDEFPARYRIAFTADETRRDGLECLVYDAFGEVIHETSRTHAEEAGAVVDVEIRLFMTDFRADWYHAEPDFDRLIREMTTNPERDKLILSHALAELRSGEQLIALTHRREHAHVIEHALALSKVNCGRMLGGEGLDAQVFAETRAGLREGSVEAGVGTYEALGEGIDLPAVAVGITWTPIWTNRQRANQVRGRLCRPSEGKESGRLYVPFDRHVFGEKILRNILAWNRTVKVLRRGEWVDARTLDRRAIMTS